MTLARILLCLGLVAATAGCTTSEWQNASQGTPPSEAEIAECKQAAYYEAQRQTFFYGGYGLGWPYYPSLRRATRGPWPRSTINDRFFVERDLFDFCMRAKGYRLVPVPESAPDT